MALARRRGSERTIDYWPGFVDALSTLVLAVVFLISVFMMAQYFLAQEISGKDTALERLNRQIVELTDLLALERSGRRTAETDLAALRSTLGGLETDRSRLQALIESNGRTQGQASTLSVELDSQKQANARALTQVEILNQQIAALRRQLAALEQALEASEARDRESQARVADLGSRLNVALAQRVQELTRYRSDFFGRLRQILGNRPDIRVVGDRFVFQSELLFDVGQSALKLEGQTEIDKIAIAILALEKDIPPDIPWVLRVDGHTDKRPFAGAAAPNKSNWDLSAARAIAVVQYLVGKGVPPQRLLAAGFAEFQPLDVAETEDAFRRNRRIELKLTER